MESGLAPFDGIGIKEPVVVPDTQERTVVPDDTAEEAVMVDKETADKIKRNKLYLDAFISSLAICIHSLFTGLALGADTSSDSAFWTFFGATVGHKMIDGFATGVPVYRAKMPFLYSLFLIALGALAAPIGILIGYFSTNSSEANLGQAIVMSMSGRSFILNFIT
jgi:zinc transporter ZupT